MIIDSPTCLHIQQQSTMITWACLAQEPGYGWITFIQKKKNNNNNNMEIISEKIKIILL